MCVQCEKEKYMSSVKCIGAVAALGAAVTGGATLYQGMKTKKQTVAAAQVIADSNGGKIPIGGRTKDGKMWDGFTSVKDIKKNMNKAVALATGFSAALGAIASGAIAGITLLAKAKIK